MISEGFFYAFKYRFSADITGCYQIVNRFFGVVPNV